MTSADRINYLNAGLMVASCVAAFIAPFELFLIAYAVLGPLHYLTEISWIHDRRYFVAPERSKWQRHRIILWLLLVGLALAVMMNGVVSEHVLDEPASPVAEIGLFYLVFMVAAVLGLRAAPVVATSAVLLAAVGVLLFYDSPSYGLIAFLLITIIHVLIFTAAFVLQGALKARSLSGALSLGVFLLCTISFFVIVPEGAAASAFVRERYGPFEALNAQMIRALGLGPGTTRDEIYRSQAGAIVIRLIAFAYTYHYLNWFTKTSVIGWNRIARPRVAAIAVLWIGSVALYAQSYLRGFVALYCLSVLHVMLELPLNHQSFAGICRELTALVRRRSA